LSLKSKETQKLYLLYISYFEQFYKNKIEELITLHPKAVEQIIINYVVFMRDKGSSYSSISGRLAAVISFLDLNDILINHKKLKKFIGESNKTIKDEAYSREDLLKMFNVTPFRTRLLILIYSSTGVRKTALADIKLKHITKVNSNSGSGSDNLSLSLYKFTIYENTKEEYTTFCTPETATYIEEYINQRKSAGEKITEESYLIRNDFDFSFKSQVRTPKRMSANSLTIVLYRLLEKIDFHETNHKTENYQYKRHKKSCFHAFRKYFNTCLVNADVNVTIKEMLMGHSVGFDDSYFRPTEKQLLTEYLKAVNELTINEENRLKKKVTELEQKQNEVDMLRYEHKKEMDSIRQQLDRMDSVFAKFGLGTMIQTTDIDKERMKRYGFNPDPEHCS
jgi:integrase